MRVTRKKVLSGIVNFVKSEMINKITDRPLKMILAAGVSALEINPSIADSIFDNSFVSQILKDDGLMCDVDSAFEILEKTLTEYGDFPVVIPAIKFISPVEKELTFTRGDIQKLKDYICGGVE